MPSLFIHRNVIAHLLQTQENRIFNCKNLGVSLWSPMTKVSWGVITSIALHLVSKPNNSRFSTTSPSQLTYALYIQFEDNQDPFILEENEGTLSFLVTAEDLNSHPLIQTIPQLPLFPPQLNSKPQGPVCLEKTIPAYPPYHCSVEESQQLLHSHIPDLPLSAFSHWKTPIIVSHTFDWPTVSEISPLKKRHYFTTGGQDLRINANLAALWQPLAHHRPLAVLQNDFIFQAIFPALSTMCAWAVYPKEGVPANFEVIHQLPSGIKYTQVVALPYHSPQNTPDSPHKLAALKDNPLPVVSPPPSGQTACAAQLPSDHYFNLHCFFPSPPHTVQPETIYQRIASHIQQRQLTALSC